METKTCKTCEQELNLLHFEIHLKRRILKDGSHQMKPYLRNSCKSCRAGKPVQIRQEKERYNYTKQQLYRCKTLKFKYGISLVEFKEMAKIQENKCKICGEEKLLNVDHCHTTGKIRGLLCTNCNLGLGNFKDNPELLTKAIKYLS